MMNYALIEDGIVTNIIWLSYANASDFPNAVPYDNYYVCIGDTYDGEYFYRNGERLLNKDEIHAREVQKILNELEEADNALINMTYNEIIGGLEE